MVQKSLKKNTIREHNQTKILGILLNILNETFEKATKYNDGEERTVGGIVEISDIHER